MPLTNHEKLALSDFLNNMDVTVLTRLAAAVTNGSIKPTSRQDAYDCVMLHTESLFQLLNLKRVSTAVLLRYLHHLKESIPGSATKEEMLLRLYQKWNLPFPSKSIHTIPPLTVASNNSYPCVHAAMSVNPYASAVIPANPFYTQPTLPDHQFEMMAAASRVTGMNHDPLLQMVRSKEALKEVNSMAFNEYIEVFAKTFYDLLNANNRGDNVNSQWLHDFDNSHFFGECKLKIMIKGASEDIELEGEGINEVFSTLSDLKREHQLYFSPNLTEQGVRSKQDSHGLVSAAVCGTLHQRSGPVGVFEQCFVLSADPFAQGSYKILETVLILRSSNAVSSMTELMITSGKKGSHNLALEGGSSAPGSISTSAPRLAIKD